MMRPRAGSALVATVLLAGLTMPAAAAEGAADVCLEVAPDALSEAERASLTAPVTEAVESRTAMFPAPVLVDEGSRIDVWAGYAGSEPGAGMPCLEPGSEWSARYGREFLEAGADQMLAEADTTPGFSSSIDIEWHPDEDRLRTVLVFAGPFDIPNGTCWVDDALSVDHLAGLVVASGEQGLETSLFGEVACRRFFDNLPDGGAGEQAVTLLPATVELLDGSVLRFVAERVDVRDDAVVVAGSLERD